MWFALLLCCTISTITCAEQKLIAGKIDQSPEIDGLDKEQFWQKLSGITVHDIVANIDIELKAAHNGEYIYFLASYPDKDESRLHRALVWKEDDKTYQNGPTREDVLVIKWGMTGLETDLSLSADKPYRADIWYWKAHRTDHAGYADDKIQYYAATRNKKSLLLISKSGKIFHLLRKGDAGESAYSPKLQDSYTENTVPKYNLREPQGSRADVRAKGSWVDGRWTIEFARKLQTGNSDDLQMETVGSYRFGVSRYEIAGRKPEPESDTPMFGSGEVGELILLSFEN